MIAAILSTGTVRLTWAAMSVNVVVLPALVALVDAAERVRPAPPTWLGTARLVAATLAIYGLLTPPLFVRLFQWMATRLRARGVDPNRLSAVLGFVGYQMPVLYGTLLVLFGDDPRIAYTAAPVSALGLVYWSWWSCPSFVDTAPL